MDDNGREIDVLIEDEINTDHRTGVETVSTKSFIVWAKAGMEETIKGVAGVTWVYSPMFEETKYNPHVDPRYNFEFVKKEVEAVLVVATR